MTAAGAVQVTEAMVDAALYVHDIAPPQWTTRQRMRQTIIAALAHQADDRAGAAGRGGGGPLSRSCGFRWERSTDLTFCHCEMPAGHSGDHVCAGCGERRANTSEPDPAPIQTASAGEGTADAPSTADPAGVPAPFRQFVLRRFEDVSGVSGTGVVAEGVQFSDGSVALRWLGERPSTATWWSIEDVEHIHGHKGLTVVAWVGGG
jgi:hypothetical protein